ncbi:MAG TPA: VOC family protein, partial [Bacteroidota bacterium]
SDTKTVDDYYNELKTKGITVVNEPTTEFWGDRIFTVRDPDGYALTFSEHVKDVSPESRSASFDVTHFLINLDLAQMRP